MHNLNTNYFYTSYILDEDFSAIPCIGFVLEDTGKWQVDIEKNYLKKIINASANINANMLCAANQLKKTEGVRCSNI